MFSNNWCSKLVDPEITVESEMRDALKPNIYTILYIKFYSVSYKIGMRK